MNGFEFTVRRVNAICLQQSPRHNHHDRSKQYDENEVTYIHMYILSSYLFAI
jgi:hypothetical protein